MRSFSDTIIIKSFADAAEKVRLGGQPLRHHDVVVAFKFEETLEVLAVLASGEDSLEVASPVVFLLGFEEDVPVLDVQAFHAVVVVQLGQLFDVAGEDLFLWGGGNRGSHWGLHADKVEGICEQGVLNLGVQR